jgi:hypothetical protein
LFDPPQGCFARELQQLLHVEVKDALLQLVGQRRVARQQVTGLFLYCSQDAALRRRHVLARQALAVPVSDDVFRISCQEAQSEIGPRFETWLDHSLIEGIAQWRRTLV